MVWWLLFASLHLFPRSFHVIRLEMQRKIPFPIQVSFRVGEREREKEHISYTFACRHVYIYYRNWWLCCIAERRINGRSHKKYIDDGILYIYTLPRIVASFFFWSAFIIAYICYMSNFCDCTQLLGRVWWAGEGYGQDPRPHQSQIINERNDEKRQKGNSPLHVWLCYCLLFLFSA